MQFACYQTTVSIVDNSQRLSARDNCSIHPKNESLSKYLFIETPSSPCTELLPITSNRCTLGSNGQSICTSECLIVNCDWQNGRDYMARYIKSTALRTAHRSGLLAAATRECSWVSRSHNQHSLVKGVFIDLLGTRSVLPTSVLLINYLLVPLLNCIPMYWFLLPRNPCIITKLSLISAIN